MLTIWDAVALSMIGFLSGYFLGQHSLRKVTSKILHAEILLAAGFYTVALKTLGRTKLMEEMIKAMTKASLSGQIHPHVLMLARSRLSEIWDMNKQP
jgi:hypothetical protein